MLKISCVFQNCSLKTLQNRTIYDQPSFFYFQQKSNQIKSTKMRFVDHNIKIKIKSKRREVMGEERNRLIKDSHLAIKDKNKLALFVRIAI